MHLSITTWIVLIIVAYIMGLFVYFFMKQLITRKKHEKDCANSRHEYAKDERAKIYRDEKNCLATIPDRCKHCGELSWDKAVEKTIHEWLNNKCQHCQKIRELIKCTYCSGKGEVNKNPCYNCGRKENTGCWCPEVEGMETCPVCHGEKQIYES